MCTFLLWQLLISQLLDRLMDRRLVDFGDMAGYLLKTINLLMLKLLQHAPRASSITAILSCLADRSRRPSDRQIAELLLKCVWKLIKSLKAGPESTEAKHELPLPLLLTRLHELHVAANPNNAQPLSITDEAMATVAFVGKITEASDAILTTLINQYGGYDAVRAAMPPEAAGGIALRLDMIHNNTDGAPLPPMPQPPAASAAASPATASPNTMVPTALGDAFEAAAPTSASPASKPPPAASPPVIDSIRAVLSPSAGAIAPEAATDAAVVAVSDPPAEADAAAVPTDSVAASALAKLHAMKQKYNIQTKHSLPATVVDGVAPAAGADASSPVPKASNPAAQEADGDAAPTADEASEREKVLSPSLNVAALRARLARLKKA